MNRLFPRVGVYIDQSVVTVAVIERGETIWSAAAQFPIGPESSDAAPVAFALGSLLDRIPRRRWPALHMDVALGAPWARVKHVRGMPPMAHHKQLVSMLRLNAARFVASSRPTIITGATVDPPGNANIGVADRGAVDVITHETIRRKLRIGCIVPAMSLECEENPAGSTRTEGSTEDSPYRETMAARVASMRGRLPLGLTARDNPAVVRRDVSPRRLAGAGAALAVSVLIYFGGQFNGERGSLTRSKAAVDSIATLSDSGIHERADLRKLDQDLLRAANFSRVRVATSLLIGEITRALPADAVITTLRIDTAAVDIVALSPRTATVVDAFSDLPDVGSPVIIGPVSREIVGPKELERATIRLRLAPDYNRDKTAFEVARDRGQ